MPHASPLAALPPIDPETGDLNAVIETPKGSRNKYKFDEERGIFLLSGVLPLGMVFPYDFGFLPSTLGGDGDPLDVLLLMDEPAFPGALVAARLLGVIEADQTENGHTERNDRLIGVASRSHTWSDVKSLSDLNADILDEIERFFVAYNETRGKRFRPRGRSSREKGKELVQEGIERYRRRPAP